MSFKFSQVSLNRLASIDLELQKVCHRALKLSSIDFGIPSSGGFRSAEEQNRLFDLKKSKCDGYEKKSYHQTGLAVDVYAYVDSAASWDEKHLTTIAAAMLQAASELGVKLQWGGHFKSFLDMPHFQIKEVK